MDQNLRGGRTRAVSIASAVAIGGNPPDTPPINNHQSRIDNESTIKNRQSPIDAVAASPSYR
jgi:hypothetical protein